MSLSDVAVIDGIKFDVTPNGGSTGGRTYIASNVQVSIKWRGQAWATSNDVNRIITQAQHLIFSVSGEWIDQLTGTKRAPALLNEDLKDESYAVELYPSSDQQKKFRVLALQPNQGSPLAAFTNGVRSDDDLIQCITREKVTRNDIEWFRKYG